MCKFVKELSVMLFLILRSGWRDGSMVENTGCFPDYSGSTPRPTWQQWYPLLTFAGTQQPSSALSTCSEKLKENKNKSLKKKDSKEFLKIQDPWSSKLAWIKEILSQIGEPARWQWHHRSLSSSGSYLQHNDFSLFFLSPDH